MAITAHNRLDHDVNFMIDATEAEPRRPIR